MDRIRRAFDEIKADEALVQKTTASLQARRGRREGARGRVFLRRMAGPLAAALVLAVGLLGYRTFFSAAAYVGIDVNPSLELALNRMDRVIGGVGYNPEGEALLQEARLNGKRYDEAAAALLDAMERRGYIGDAPLVAVTVQTADPAKEQALCDALLQAVNQGIGSPQAPDAVQVFPVGQEARESARQCHMSTAKYLAIQELLEVDEAATLEDYSGSTLRQIRQRTQACRDGHEAGGDAADNEIHGNGNGWGRSNGQGQGEGNGSGHGRGHHGGN